MIPFDFDPFGFFGPSARDVLAAVSRVETKLDALGRKLMTQYSDLATFLADIDVETNRIAVLVEADNQKIADLSAQVAAGTPVTQEQLDALGSSLAAKAAALRSIGADPANPIPAPAA